MSARIRRSTPQDFLSKTLHNLKPVPILPYFLEAKTLEPVQTRPCGHTLLYPNCPLNPDCLPLSPKSGSTQTLSRLIWIHRAKKH